MMHIIMLAQPIGTLKYKNTHDYKNSSTPHPRTNTNQPKTRLHLT